MTIYIVDLYICPMLSLTLMVQNAAAQCDISHVLIQANNKISLPNPTRFHTEKRRVDTPFESLLW